MRIFSEVELMLPSKWFTGAEWANGTAQRFHREEYRKASTDAAKRPREPRVRHVKTFERLRFEDNKGLSPMEICQRAMRKPC